MPIPNLLTKLIININRLPYEKQEELLRISEGWLNPGPPKKKESSPGTDFTKQETLSQVTQITIQNTDVGSEPEVTLFEERAYERKDLMVPIEFVGGGNLFKEITKDISAGGLFIKTNKQSKFKKGQKVSMVFLLNDDKKPFKLLGKIIRIEPDGIGVQFSNISAFECVAIEEELNSIRGKDLS